MCLFRGFRDSVSYRGSPGLRARMSRSYCQPHSLLSAPWQSQWGRHAYSSKHIYTDTHGNKCAHTQVYHPRTKVWFRLESFSYRAVAERKIVLNGHNCKNALWKLSRGTRPVNRDWVKLTTSWQLIQIRCWTHLNPIQAMHMKCIIAKVILSNKWWYGIGLLINSYLAKCVFVFHCYINIDHFPICQQLFHNHKATAKLFVYYTSPPVISVRTVLDKNTTDKRRLFIVEEQLTSIVQWVTSSDI